MNREPMIGDVISLSKTKAKLVVEKTAIDNDCHCVWARRLEILKGKDMEMWKYEPEGRLVKFFTSERLSKVIDPVTCLYILFKHIKFLGQMKMMFVK